MHTQGTEISFLHPSGTFGTYSGPMAALYGFTTKFGRKINENVLSFFSRKKHFKTRSETRFHQNRQIRANFRLKNVKMRKT